ncbi:MAG TPA: choice-of-anchor Q domain-containing protein [Thermoanaerobaculia bacterium]|nr:choice-of-anchor Q domain-containing protein [Thermoanaerobaculia bacterium]
MSADPAGNFVVVWESEGSLGNDPDYSIQARRYRWDGDPLDAAEFQVNTYTPGGQAAPRAGHDGEGNFVVVWYGWGDGQQTGVWGRRFRADGQALDASDFAVNTVTSGDQWEPSIAVLPSGEFVVAWGSYASLGSDPFYSIQARRFGSDGTPLDATELQVNTFTTSYQDHATVSASPSGAFLVAWDSLLSAAGDPFYSVQARRFSPDGAPLEPAEQQLNVVTSGRQVLPQIATNAEGDFVVLWHSEVGSGNDPWWSVEGRRLRADGTPVEAGEWQLNTYTTQFQQFPRVATTPAGDFVATWESYGSAGTDGDELSVQARRFGRPTIPVTSLSGGTGGPGCTLRDAITAANSGAATGGCAAGNEGAVVELPAGATIALGEVDNGLNALPRIERPVTIRGEGARIERDPGLACPLGPEFRLFEVADGGVLTLEDVAVSNGCLTSDSGAGVYASGGSVVLREASIEGNETGGDGGGLALVAGNLLAFDSTLRGNLAAGSGGGLALTGSPDQVWISGSTISENAATSGAGLSHRADADVFLRNSTISGNAAWTSGGGVELDAPGANLLAEFTTLTDNAAAGGAGARIETGVLSLHGSLLGGNTSGADCAAGAGSLDATGLNLDSDGTCAALAGGAVATVASLGLGPLAGNGGPTRTHLPLAGSPALDAAPECATRATAALSRDQRGYPRPTDDDGDLDPECELGAVERGPLFLDGFEAGSTARWSASQG